MAETPETIQAAVLQLFEQTTGKPISLSEDESVYDLNYVRQKLSLISSQIEALSTISMQLSRYSFAVLIASGDAKALKGMKERELRSSSDYHDLPRDEKTAWLNSQLQPYTEAHESWSGLSKLVSEIKESVSARDQTLKRLDSDIRLQAKLYEQAVQAGATAPPTLKGGDVNEIDL